MFSPKLFENSQPDGFPVLEIPQPEDRPRRFVPLKRTDLKGEIVGPLAILHLTQTFLFTREQFDKPVEALYRFPLPGDAAVTKVAVRFGETRIEASLAEREVAEAEYNAAKQEGRQAALTTRESPDVFTLRLAGIQPNEAVTVETAYVQYARPESGARWSLRVPLTTAPRYTRTDEGETRAAQGQPLALLRDPGHRFSLDLTLPDAGDVRSQTHSLTVECAAPSDALLPAISHIRLSEGEVMPDRDFVLTWRADSGGAEQAQPEPARLQVWRQDTVGGDNDPVYAYFLAQITPPRWRGPHTEEGIGREVILLVDHSGSMEGAKWAAADWAVTRFLSDLTERDTFALGLFHNSTRWFSPKPLAAKPDVTAKAIEFLTANTDSGGTELGVALEQALKQPKDNGERARHVLIVTDAEVTDAGRILRLVETEAAIQDPLKRRRISVLCIDAAPNAYLANEVAEQGGGIARFLTSDPAQEDITTALDALLEDWAEPVYAHLRLVVDRPGGEASVGIAPVTAARDAAGANKTAFAVGDLPGGRTVTFVGRVPVREAENGPLTFRATLSNGTEITPAVRRTAGTEHPGLPALFGARRILGLEQLMAARYGKDELTDRLRRLGYSAEQMSEGRKATKNSLYPENQQTDDGASVKSLLVRESLRYGILSAETAFVATRKEAGVPIAQTVVVANAVPFGWVEEGNATLDWMGAAPAGVLYAASPSPAPAPARSFLRGVAGAFKAKKQRPSPKRDISLAESASILDDAVYERAESAPATSAQAPLFEGIPAFADGTGRAVLYDSDASGAVVLPGTATFTQLAVAFPSGAPEVASLGSSLTLLLYVDDLTTPRARVRLSDLLRQGGVRPLNLLRGAGQRVYLVLADEDGIWSGGNAPEMTVTLS